ncbi:hypothetical protein PSU4_55200 [Pseudonocardia sulfidoxydans NBRC 16205]|uniref:Transmembrane protein n=1 Tax=Pseudonocardia sulfidoxydans NBRC 16205 TaxID=1223511 RepID=A0A511DP22_9PSEU|nr:hypothetical protein [Pseudonocardia sulfidoxydans]GEL26566.1 hypothetical protein PSU4_55200 [Pseudonocardia sulfidoxydans NBRC 16205]
MERATDRARARLRRSVATLVALVLLLALPIGLLAHDWERSRSEDAAARLSPVTAVVLEFDAAPAALPYPADTAMTMSRVVRYAAPDGSVHTATLPVAVGAPDETTMQLWVDRRGVVGEPPSSPDVARNVGIVLAIAWTVVAWTAVVLIAITVRMRLDEMDSEQWDREWARVEPLWSGRIP